MVDGFLRFGRTFLTELTGQQNQWLKGEEESLQKLKDFARDAGILGCTSVLVVSGGGHKKTSTAGMLTLLAAQGGLPLGSSPLHCAYNPYFPSEEEQQAERASLKEKLSSGLCKGLWLQIGSDATRYSVFLALQECRVLITEGMGQGYGA